MRPSEARERVVTFDARTDDPDHRSEVCGHLSRTCRAIAEHPERYVTDGLLAYGEPHEVVIRVPLVPGKPPTVSTSVTSFVVEG